MVTERRVFLIDDDMAVCHALSVFLESCGYIVSMYHSAEAFLAEATPVSNGVMLLDQRMTGMSGLELQDELGRRHVELPIIFITGHGDVQMSVKAVKAGAIDFLEKPFSNEALLASISEAFLQFDSQQHHRDSVTEMNRRFARLTEREREVMKHVVAGLSNRQLAKRLGVSDRTVEVHRSRGMKKMGADSLPDLVRKYTLCNGGDLS